jgi:hypothetical protein
MRNSMTNLLNRRRLMMVICLVATLALAACGDDNGGNNGGGNNGGGNNGADAGDQDTGDQDGGDQDGGDEDTNGGGGCDLTGFTSPTGMTIDESAFAWSLYGETDSQAVSLTLYKEGGTTGTGEVEFEDLPFADIFNELLLGDNCGDEGCETLYVAVSGTLNITEWDMENEGGNFAAELTDLELVELAQTQSGYERVENGQTWCVDSLSLSATTDVIDTFPDTVDCDRDGFTAADGEISAVASDQGPLIVEAPSAAQAPRDVLSLQIYPSVTGAATTVGTHELDGSNYADCANCVLVYTECAEGDDTCEPQTFLAGEGTLDISSAGTGDDGFAVGEQFTATMTDAKLVVVIIDQSFESTIVEDGEGWCIDSFSWDVTLEAPESE